MPTEEDISTRAKVLTQEKAPPFEVPPGAPGKVPTTLSVGVTPQPGKLGDTFTIAGTLSRADTGEGLAGKQLILTVDGVDLSAFAITGGDGRYSVPYKPEKEGTFTASVSKIEDDTFAAAIVKGGFTVTPAAPGPVVTPPVTPSPPPISAAVPPPAGFTSWSQIYGVDPPVIIASGTKLSEDQWFDIQNKAYGSPAAKSSYQRFTGSNGTVAYGYAPGGVAVKAGEDSLGQPLLTSSVGGRIFIVSWNANIYSYQGQYMDLLQYVLKKGS